MKELGVLRGSGGGGKKPKPPKEAPNTLQATTKAKLVDLLQYGHSLGLSHGLKSVFLDGTPLQNDDGTFNFEGIRLQFREGLPNQEVLEGFRSVDNVVDVSTDVKYGAPVVRSLTNANADAAIVTIQLQALYKQDSNGNIDPHSVSIAIDWRVNQGEWRTGYTDTIRGKTMSPYVRSYRINFGGAKGDIDLRVRRLSEDDKDSKYQSATRWAMFNEVIDRKLNYPNMTLVGIEVDAQEFGNSIPERTYDMMLSIIQVPSNYDPYTREYSGLWDGTFKWDWSNNPAWVFYDIATDPIIGADVGTVDKWELYRIARWCDELVPDGKGGMEPRFTFNGVIAGEEDAITALNSLASVFRGSVYWGSNTVVPVADMPEDPVLLVTPANIVGDFSYSETGQDERHSVAVVMFNDPENGYELTPVVYEDPRSIEQFGWRETRVTAMGCTSRGQALRLAKWILYSERHETETLTYRATLENSLLRPGNIITVADPSRAGARVGGRVLGTGISVLTLDTVPEDLPAHEWYFSVTMADGTIAQRKIEDFLPDNQIRLAQPLPEEPLVGAVWVISSLEQKLPQWRVVEVQEDGLLYSITATQYDRRKYQYVEQGLELPEPISSLNPRGPIGVPGALNVATEKYVAGGTEHQKLLISWSPSGDPRAVNYLLEGQGPGEVSWRTLHTGPGTMYEVLDAEPGRWALRVRAENGLGLASQWVALTTEIEGLLTPAAPTSVEVDVGTFSVALRPRSPNANAQYEFWRATTPLSESQVENNAVFLTVSSDLVDLNLTPDTQYYYWVRGINIYGVSGWYPVQARTDENISEILDLLYGQIREEHLYSKLGETIGLIEAPETVEGSVSQRIKEARDQLGQSILDMGDSLGSALEDAVEGLGSAVGGLDEAVGGLLDRAGRIEFGLDDLGSQLTKEIDDTSASVTQLQRVQEEADALRAIEFRALEASSQGNQAKIIHESTVRQTDDEALAQEISVVSARVEGVNSATEASIEQLTTALSNTESALTQQITQAQSTANSGVSKAEAAQSAAQAASDLAGGKGRVFFQNSSPPPAERLPQNLWIDTTGGANTPKRWNGSAWIPVTDKVATDAAAAAAAAQGAVNTLDARVTQEVNTLAAADQALTQQITQAQSTANSGVSKAEAAQSAAQAASDLAGGKGRVFFQSSAPPTAERLAQNLWIDTTGGANTPKRWNGSAWVAVTDKVATDAAAAAAAAQGAVNTLDARVTQEVNTLAAADQALTQQITQAQSTANSGVSKAEAAQSAAQAASDLAGGKGRVFFQNSAPPSAERLPQNLWIDTTGGANTPKRWNGSAWVAVTDKVATDAAAAAAAAQGAVNTLDARVTQEVNTLAAADQALASSIQDVQASVGDSIAQVTDVVTALADEVETSAEAVRRLDVEVEDLGRTSYDLAGSIQAVQRVVAENEALMAVQHAAMEAQAGANRAGIYTEQTTRADEVSAVAQQISTLQAQVDDDIAAIQQTLTAEVGPNGSLAQQINQVAATAASGLSKAEAAESAANAAASVAGGKGRVFFQNSSPPSAERLPQNLWIDTTGGANTPKRWNGSAWIPVTDKVATDAAAAATAAQNAVTTLDARVTNEVNAITGPNGAIAQQINTVQTALGAQIAAVQQLAEAGGGANDRLEAMWALRVDVNGHVSGIGLANDGQESSFAVRADKFYIARSGAAGSEVLPFVVQNNTVYMNSAMIQNASIGSAKIADAAITSAKIADYIQSSNYVANQSGWRINKDGTFELNGSVAGQGRMRITNRAVIVYDSAGRKRVQLGDLSV